MPRKVGAPPPKLTFSGPDGVTAVEPTAEFLEGLIFRERGGIRRGGSGDASLSVPIQHGPRSFGTAPGQPTLMFFLVAKHGFFFTHFEKLPDEVVQWVPFAGGPSRPWVKHYIGGDVFFAPRACFVSRPFAWEVVQEFVRSRGRSSAVPWVNRDNLQFPYPPAGDKAPAKADQV